MHCGAGCPGVGLGCVCVSGCLVVCVGVRGGWVGEGHAGGVPRGGCLCGGSKTSVSWRIVVEYVV